MPYARPGAVWDSVLRPQGLLPPMGRGHNTLTTSLLCGHWQLFGSFPFAANAGFQQLVKGLSCFTLVAMIRSSVSLVFMARFLLHRSGGLRAGRPVRESAVGERVGLIRWRSGQVVVVRGFRYADNRGGVWFRRMVRLC